MDVAFAIAVIEKMIADVETRIEFSEDLSGKAVLYVKLEAYKEILKEIEPMANA